LSQYEQRVATLRAHRKTTFLSSSQLHKLKSWRPAGVSKESAFDAECNNAPRCGDLIGPRYACHEKAGCSIYESVSVGCRMMEMKSRVA